jgi:hypothetical protein
VPDRLRRRKAGRVGEDLEDLGDGDVAVEVGSDEDDVADVKFAARRALETYASDAQRAARPRRACGAPAVGDEVDLLETRVAERMRISLTSPRRRIRRTRRSTS